MQFDSHSLLFSVVDCIEW